MAKKKTEWKCPAMQKPWAFPEATAWYAYSDALEECGAPDNTVADAREMAWALECVPKMVLVATIRFHHIDDFEMSGMRTERMVIRKPARAGRPNPRNYGLYPFRWLLPSSLEPRTEYRGHPAVFGEGEVTYYPFEHCVDLSDTNPFGCKIMNTRRVRKENYLTTPAEFDWMVNSRTGEVLNNLTYRFYNRVRTLGKAQKRQKSKEKSGVLK